MTRPPHLPDFSDPPLVEVALTVQFSPLAAWSAATPVQFWVEHLRDRFPVIEEHPVIETPIEAPEPARGRPGIRVALVEGPKPSRFFFISESNNELIQLQQDRIVHNWRKVGSSEEYPRYEAIREAFGSEVHELAAFMSSLEFEFEPTQCEVTYVNHISASAGDLPQPGAVVEPWSASYHNLAGCQLESTEFNLRHQIRGPGNEFQGRLYVDMKPATRVSDGKPLYVLQLTARGLPLDHGIDGALAFLDYGREILGRGFSDLTTEAMHSTWGKS